MNKIQRWRSDPLYFVAEELKAQPDPWQVDFLRAFGDPEKRRIAMRACKGPGKTAVLAWAIWNFMACYGDKGQHPKGAATSITADNIDDNLWPELSKWQQRSGFLKQAFEWKKERIYAKDHPETWFFSKRTWPKSGDISQQANTLAGLHSEFLLFVLDESGGIPDSVMAAAEGGLSTGRWGKIIQAGNPTHKEGPLYRACTTERHLWHLITITGDPDSTQRSSRISIQWAREQIEKYGRNNPWVLVNVFGEFPPSSLNSLLGVEEVEAAMRRTASFDKYEFSQKRLGIDAARFGDDSWVIFPRQGLVSFNPVAMRNPRSHDVAARVVQGKLKWGSEMEFFDDTGGFASGAIDSMIQAGYSPTPVNFSGKSIDPRYYNKRAEMYFSLAEWVKRGGCLPNVPEIVAELTTPTYFFHNGKFQIEDKEQIKERLGRSPNYADGLALTFAIPDMPSSNSPHAILSGSSHAKLLHEYDPFR